MTKRVKRATAPAVTNREELEAAARRVALALIERDALVADLEGEIADVRARYEARIAEATGRAEAALPDIQEYCERDRGNWALKALELVHASVGFRMGTPKTKLRKGFKWELVVERLKALLPEYVRTKVEPDKDRLIADRAVKLPGAEGEEETVGSRLALCGCDIVQEESFFLEPKRESFALPAGVRG